MRFDQVVQAQRDFFLTNQTKNYKFRREQLLRLSGMMDEYETQIYHALYKDLNKSEYEAYLTEISIVKMEIKYVLKHLNSWMKPVRKKSCITVFPNKSYTIKEPYGVVLVLSPWNYPIQLSLMPIIGAIAAGNCVILKSSPSSVYTTKLLQDMIRCNFSSHFLAVVEDNVSYDNILKEKYDQIFFTGSPRVGKIVMRAASEHLTPVVLELGGKSPCIVDKSADLRKAAEKIIWAKCINSGQTCVAPDFILVDENVKEDLIQALSEEINKNYKHCVYTKEYPRIINLHHYMRLSRLIDKETDVIGGRRNEEDMKIAPAIIPNATFESSSMKEEIFGPILPVLTYSNIDAALEELKLRDKPLACYIFTRNEKFSKKIIGEFSFGGGCINDCVMHIANHNLPFGGVGNSGMGSYHGKYSFDTFSHEKCILLNRGIYDIPLRFMPLTEEKLNALRKLI